MCDAIKEITINGTLIMKWLIDSSHVFESKDLFNIFEVLDSSEKVTVYIHLSKMSVNSKDFHKPMLIISKYNKQIDLEISFDSSEFKNHNFEEIIRDMYYFSSKFSISYTIDNFYGGVEPLWEQENRFFSCGKLFI